MMTYGEVVADGDVIVLQVFMEHVIHIGEVVLRTLVLGKMPHDDTFQLRKDASYFKQMEHTVDL